VKFLYCFFVLACLIGCGDSQAESSKVVNMKIGDVGFSIPSKYILPGFPATVVANSGLDKSEGVNLKIPYQDLGLESENGGSLDSNLIVMLSPLSAFVHERGVTLDAYNAWHGDELYADRIVEKDKSTGLYRVGSEAAYPLFWHYFSSPPNGEEKAEEAWVASCSEATSGKPICSKVIAFKGTQSDLSTAGNNINRLADLEAAYRELLSSWVTNLQGSAG